LAIGALVVQIDVHPATILQSRATLEGM